MELRKGKVICSIMYSHKVRKPFKHKDIITERMVEDFDAEIALGNIEEIIDEVKAETPVVEEKPEDPVEETKAETPVTKKKTKAKKAE